MSESVDRILGRIEAKLDAALKTQDEQHTRLNNHGDRLAKIERWQSKTLGAAAVIAVIASYAVKVLLR